MSADSDKPVSKGMIKLALVATALVVGGIATFLAKADDPSTKSAGWLPWALLVMGVVSVLGGVLDENPGKGPGTGYRTQGAVLLLGPVGARFLFAVLGGGFGGAGLGLLIS